MFGSRKLAWLAAAAVAFAPMPALAQPGPAPARADAPVTLEWLLGTWSDRPDCSEPFTLQANGQALMGGGWVAWRLEGSTIVIMPANQPEARVPIRRISDNEMRVIDGDTPSYRCPSPSI